MHIFMMITIIRTRITSNIEIIARNSTYTEPGRKPFHE